MFVEFSWVWDPSKLPGSSEDKPEQKTNDSQLFLIADAASSKNAHPYLIPYFRSVTRTDQNY